MKKNARIAAQVQDRPAGAGFALPGCYLAFFTCFNAQQYYEAHDVLEHLWLQKKDANWHFFKGLIQVAGAFVHLQKQFSDPHHVKHGRRLHPAMRLFRRGAENLEGYRPAHMALNVESLHQLCLQMSARLEQSEFRINPWTPATAPRLDVPGDEKVRA